METNKDTAVPPGKYELKETGCLPSGEDYIWAVRTTANGKYKDDVLFEVADAGDGNSSVHALSRSTEFALGDLNVNFCNTFNIVKQLQPAIKDGKNYTVGDCLFN